jgi:hypothetical protein
MARALYAVGLMLKIERSISMGIQNTVFQNIFPRHKPFLQVESSIGVNASLRDEDG